MRILRMPDGRILQVRAILAMDLGGIIGYDGHLIFNNKEDLKHFQSFTTGNICVMGRKTFEGMGKVLPKRQTFVMSKQIGRGEAAIEKIITKSGLPKDTPRPISIKTITAIPKLLDPNLKVLPKIYICGGAEIYDLCRQYVGLWMVTRYGIDLEKAGAARGYLPAKFRPSKIDRIDPGILSGISWTTTRHSSFDGIPIVYRNYQVKTSGY